MPRDVAAREWWADVYEVRERIEARRAVAVGSTAEHRTARRGVRELHTAPRLTVVRAEAPAPAHRSTSRRPPTRPIQRIGPRPDRIASWAVALGVLLVLLAILSAH